MNILFFYQYLNVSKKSSQNYVHFQKLQGDIKFFLGSVSILCITISNAVSSILCAYYSSVPYIKKNILTRLDELFVRNWNIFVCLQGFVVLNSLIFNFRNEYVYFGFYVILYGSLALAFMVTISITICRVIIIIEVKLLNQH